MKSELRGKTAFITGASRGIGKAMALALAGQGVNVAVAAKTSTPHPKLEGTIHSTAAEIEALGAKALPIQLDVRSEEQVAAGIQQCVNHFGGLDILINNASAIMLANTEFLPMKRFDLMHEVNARGTYMCSKYAIPHLRKSDNAHILILSPPLNLKPHWFGSHLGYTLSKYGMSMCVIGLAEELQDDNIAVNGLWPVTTIATAAIRNLLGGEAMIQVSRTPDIMADAALAILQNNPHRYSGKLLLDEDVLKASGIDNFDHYAINPDATLQTDLFLDQ